MRKQAAGRQHVRAKWIAGIGVAVITFVVFLPALWNDFVNWDDPLNFLTNPAYRGLGWPQLRWMWTSAHSSHYIPITWMTLGLDYALWGMNPMGYHLTNNVIHSLNAVLFFGVALRLTGSVLGAGEKAVRSPWGWAAFAALLFSLHPLRVESVAWVTERRDVLSGFFYLLTLYGYVRYAETLRAAVLGRLWLWLSIGSFALALLSKSITMTLPLVLILLDAYPLRRIQRAGGFWPYVGQTWLEKVPFVVLAAAAGSGALFLVTSHGVTTTYREYGLVPRLAQSIYGAVFYFWKTVLPIRLSPLYELKGGLSVLGGPFLLSAAAFLGISATAILLARKQPAGLVAWLCHLIVLSPVLGIVHIGPQVAADRYSYLACMPWPILAAVGLRRIQGSAGSRAGSLRRGVASGAAVFLCGTLALLTVDQISVWRNSVSLWTHVLRRDPAAATAHYNLARAYQDRGRWKEAESHYERLLRMDSGHSKARNNLANVLIAQGRFDDASRHLQKIIDSSPDLAEPVYNMGNIHYWKGDLQQATAFYRKALSLRPGYAGPHRRLGEIKMKRKDFAGALGHFEAALALNPAIPGLREQRDEAAQAAGLTSP
jgi:protein O-mannosyl-transferase